MLSVVGNIVADRNAALANAVRTGDLDEARTIDGSPIPVVEAVMRTSPGAVTAKAALAELGIIPAATVRLPLLEAERAHLRQLTDALSAAGVRTVDGVPGFVGGAR